MTGQGQGQHTPGPWYVGQPIRKRVYSTTDLEIQSGYKVLVATLYSVNFSMDGVRDMANARLMAAAPDLLAACKLALGAFEHAHAIDWNELSRAIAKAEGREE